MCGDANASLLPYLDAVKQPFSVISSGTWTIHMTVGGSTENLDPERDSLANVDAYGQAVPTARFMGGREYELIMGEENPNVTPHDIDYILDNQIFILPSFTTGVGPFPSQKGKWVGDNTNLTNVQRGAAAALYLALMSQQCLELAECGNSIIVEGPLAQSFCYCGILSALTNRPVFGSSDVTGTSLGASMLFASPDQQNIKAPAREAVKCYKNSKLEQYADKWLSLIA